VSILILPRDCTPRVKLLKQDVRTKSIPIVAVTSYAMAGDRETIITAGCAGHIEKPIGPDSFVD